LKDKGFLRSLIPPRFELVEQRTSTLAIHQDAGRRLRELVLASAGERGKTGSVYEGRGVIQRVVYDPDRSACAIFRRYRHGGLLRWLTGDKLFNAWRPFRELEVVEQAREKGVPTAEVLAVRVDRVGFFLYQGEMVTREIEDAPDLIHWLTKEPAPAPAVRRSVVRVLGGAVARMHLAGVLHADLHLKNLLLRCRDQPEAFVIDLDKASRFRPGGLTLSAVLVNLIRLDRSVEKFNLLEFRGITRQDRVRFLDAYLEVFQCGLALREAVRRIRTRFLVRRLKWWVMRWLRRRGSRG